MVDHLKSPHFTGACPFSPTNHNSANVVCSLWAFQCVCLAKPLSRCTGEGLASYLAKTWLFGAKTGSIWHNATAWRRVHSELAKADPDRGRFRSEFLHLRVADDNICKQFWHWVKQRSALCILTF